MNTELYHYAAKRKAANKNHKYVSREWKNGRWNYTYPGDNKSNGQKRMTDTDNWLSSKTTIKTGDKTIETYNRGKIDRTLDAGKAKIKSYVDGVKRDWDESKKRGTEKAIKEATKYDGGIVIKNDKYGARDIKATFKDSDYLLDGSTVIDTGDLEIREFRRGKLTRFVDTAKEYVKDRLGFDEKEAYTNAKAEHDFSKRMSDKSQKKLDLYDKAFSDAIKLEDYEKKIWNDAKDTNEYLQSQTYEAKKKYDEAKEVYYDTPIGKVAEAKETIDSAKDYIDNLFGRKRKK